MQSTPSHRITFKSTLILSSYLRLHLPCDLSLLALPANIVHAFLIYSIHATYTAYPIIMNLFTKKYLYQ
jgi:hypothetical protein